MSQTNINNKLKARPILVEARTGREVSKEAADKLRADDKDSVLDRFNGPHHDAKWAREALGTPTQSEVRRRNLMRLRGTYAIPAPQPRRVSKRVAVLTLGALLAGFERLA